MKMLTEAVTVVSRAVRQGKSARKIFKKAGFLIPFGNDIDHIIDLQLGGANVLSNFALLDSSVNRSLGAQIWNQIKNLPIGTAINKVTIGER
ncbi:HNH endonuclease [Mesorhizobium caraganae]|uniref:HNH endonuclease n=1 Tax=Mesorhizobium caraganae TaxID=483206 RepID=A0ABV1Z2G2_9HYPH